MRIILLRISLHLFLDQQKSMRCVRLLFGERARERGRWEKRKSNRIIIYRFRISFWNVTHMLWASYKWSDGEYILPAKVANRLMWWKSEKKPMRESMRGLKWSSKPKRDEARDWTSEQPEMKNAFQLVSIFNRFIIQFHK